MQMSEAQRASRLQRVFGDVLPDSTADDRPPLADPDIDIDPDPDGHDRWLRDNRPPHHDT